MNADPDDLLGKADALMARHHPGRAPTAPLAEIPVLDEVVDFMAAGDHLPLLTEYVVPATLDAEQAEALAQSMRAALLADLQPRIDAMVEERLKESLAPLVEKMLDDLRGSLQLLSREILEDAIHSAVEQELDRSKWSG